MSSYYYISSNPIPYAILCCLSSLQIQKLRFGLNFLELPSRDPSRSKAKFIRLIIYQNSDKSLIICRNLCRHAGGNFIHDIEDSPEIVRCAFHGWKLNVQTLEYTHPADCLKQKRLEIDQTNENEWLILEPALYDPWMIDAKEKQVLHPDELTITFISHACIEIQAGPTRLFIDPWLIGPAYDRSWWLLHDIDANSLERIANADGIFISKSTPDHFNRCTLRRIVQLNACIHVYAPEMLINSLEQLGFVNTHCIRLGIWEEMPTSECRMMILPDHKHPYDDWTFLFEYKGYRILNLVDCSSPNGDFLPYGVDILLTNFTSNKNAYPSCFMDQFNEKKVLQLAKNKDEKFIKSIIRFIQLSSPTVWIPVGGYFLEADEQIRRLNWKNDPMDVAEQLRARFRYLKTWCPFPNGKYDVGSSIGDSPKRSMDDYLAKSTDFQHYNDRFERILNNPSLETMKGVEEYFKWTLFNNYDLILHIIEVKDDFSDIIQEYYIDFLNSSPLFPPSRPIDRPYLRIRIHASVIRHVFFHGLSWNYVFNSFSGRYLAQPDVYHRKFWNHFKYNLPSTPPRFDESSE
ncbi:unnamed protein product [Adineta ricciae]|uniref:Cytidine monophosphate-N-acetylneuraminic acid hydroxylase n=1 Tax=Adineta ricciae TaxID=249248 RepID=A0A815CYK6_ADIRI|nr:unnamed protein product [Adineta ricciae]CAF1580001.1 unnamed protein product [Adineta ricciae]